MSTMSTLGKEATPAAHARRVAAVVVTETWLEVALLAPNHADVENQHHRDEDGQERHAVDEEGDAEVEDSSAM
jgi:hypothetical protein